MTVTTSRVASLRMPDISEKHGFWSKSDRRFLLQQIKKMKKRFFLCFLLFLFVPLQKI